MKNASALAMVDTGEIAATNQYPNFKTGKGTGGMQYKTTLTVTATGEIVIPLEANQYLNLKDCDWIKVKLEADRIVIIPPQVLDETLENLVEQLIHAGILANPE